MVNESDRGVSHLDLRDTQSGLTMITFDEIVGHGRTALVGAATDGNRGTLLLDFGRMDYINSADIAQLIGLVAEARTSGSRLLAFGLNAHCLEILSITHLICFLEVFPDKTSALQALAPAKMAELLA